MKNKYSQDSEDEDIEDSSSDEEEDNLNCEEVWIIKCVCAFVFNFAVVHLAVY